MLILKIKEMKRLTKKIKMGYTRLDPGESWIISSGEYHLTIIAAQTNTDPMYVGKEGRI